MQSDMASHSSTVFPPQVWLLVCKYAPAEFVRLSFSSSSLYKLAANRYFDDTAYDALYGACDSDPDFEIGDGHLPDTERFVESRKRLAAWRLAHFAANGSACVGSGVFPRLKARVTYAAAVNEARHRGAKGYLDYDVALIFPRFSQPSRIWDHGAGIFPCLNRCFRDVPGILQKLGIITFKATFPFDAVFDAGDGSRPSLTPIALELEDALRFAFLELTDPSTPCILSMQGAIGGNSLFFFPHLAEEGYVDSEEREDDPDFPWGGEESDASNPTDRNPPQYRKLGFNDRRGFLSFHDAWSGWHVTAAAAWSFGVAITNGSFYYGPQNMELLIWGAELVDLVLTQRPLPVSLLDQTAPTVSPVPYPESPKERADAERRQMAGAIADLHPRGKEFRAAVESADGLGAWKKCAPAPPEPELPHRCHSFPPVYTKEYLVHQHDFPEYVGGLLLAEQEPPSTKQLFHGPQDSFFR
uniref:Uncharacterized protein n=1 Tax=Chromera velia CCMP2878 TaxID=1169474 RepID=A0A0G4IAB7_9ALVE|eukprot:Cvel_2103.t1-p1 / transcript=Cvel_2103.t1 / gene=Cvel_2103 / organism=Chromera_velia_CCMP2878 / gene_product=hypothetical protein / transcript_product=hypothetical protein / location=Cvel_scaffold81:51321-52727(-) / protein_length=469 / sequence_SO=supercontig / SO=protein_coding / is_pseudo=false